MNTYFVYYDVESLDAAVGNIAELIATVPDKHRIDAGMWVIHADHVVAGHLAFSPGSGRLVITKLTAKETWILGYEDDALNQWLQKHGL